MGKNVIQTCRLVVITIFHFILFFFTILKNFKTNGTTINCPTCKQETIFPETIDKSLQTNFYIIKQLENPNLPVIAKYVHLFIKS